MFFWLAIGLTMAILCKPWMGCDEGMHIARAEQIARGGVCPQQVSVDEIDTSITGVVDAYRDCAIYGGQTDSAIYELLAKSVSDSADATTFPGWNDSQFYVDMQVGESTVTWAFPNTSLNSPLAYLPHVVGYWFARLVTDSPWVTIALMRVFGVVAYGAIVYLAIRMIPFAKWLLFAIAVSLNSVLINSLVSADTMTASLSFLFVAMVMRFCGNGFKAQRLDWLLLGLSLCALGLLKLPYVLLGLLLFLIVAVNRDFRDRASLLRFVTIGLASLALLFLWQSCASGVQSYTIWGDIGADSMAQMRFMIAHPLSAFKAILSTFVSDSFGLFLQVPNFPVWPIIALFFCAFLVEGRERIAVEHRKGIACMFLAVSMLGCLTVCAALYLTFTEVGASKVDGVQVRYYLPFLLLALISLYLLCSCSDPEEKPSDRHLPINSGSVMLVGRYKSICVPMVVCTVFMALFYIRYCITWFPHLP